MSGEVIGKMVSRRKILSQSRDELSYEPGPTEEPEDDVWFTKEKLYKVFCPKKERETPEDIHSVLLGTVSSTSAFMVDVICVHF